MKFQKRLFRRSGIITLLTLLYEKPKSHPLLYETQLFKGQRHLQRCLEVCRKAGLIEFEKVEIKKSEDKIWRNRFWKRIPFYRLTDLGKRMLEMKDEHSR